MSVRQELVINFDLENADVVVSDFFALLLGCVLIIVLVPEDVVAGVEGFVVVVVVVVVAVAVEFLPPPQPNILRSSEPLL